MSEFNQSQQHPDSQQLESLVRAAGGYVHPTDNLRPKSLEAARDACWQRRISLRLGSLALLVALFNLSGLPKHLVASHSGLRAVESSELHRRAAQNVLAKGASPHWALFEVFSDYRRGQADRLRPDRDETSDQ